MLKRWILRHWYAIARKSPADMPMIRYWRHKDAVEAKLVEKDGAQVMVMEGEDYPIAAFPRGHLIINDGSEYSKLSVLKHQIKWQVFNDTWRRLEDGRPDGAIIRSLYDALGRIVEVGQATRLDRIPKEHMHKPVKEIHRAWMKVAPGELSKELCEIFCFIIEEDDSYRYRVQFLAEWFNPNRWWMRLLGRDPVDQLERALKVAEHAEVVGDMKERQRLWRRIILFALKDPNIRRKFLAFCKEVDWRKVYLSKGDKYNFRGKYHKVDYGYFDY